MQEGNPKDSQVALEQKALANVRATLDEIEDQDTHRFRGMATQVVVVVGVIAAAVLGLNFYKSSQREAPATPTTEMTAAQYVEHALARIEERANKKFKKHVEGIPGQGLVRFTIGPKGYTEAEVLKSSGDRVLDGSFTLLVKLGEPFGIPPAEAMGATGVVEITRVFRVDDDRHLVIDR